MRFPQDAPRLSWVNSKTHPSSNPRKNMSSHAPEHEAANLDHAALTIEAFKKLKQDQEQVQEEA